MRKVRFEEAVKNIQKRDPRFKADSYQFLRETLDFTVKNLREDEPFEHRHVSGPELLKGLRDYSLEKFGPMALPVLESWGIHNSKDIGDMVYNLIREGAFGKSEDDEPGDFENWMSFEEAFQNPFRPSRNVLSENRVDGDGDGDSRDHLDPPQRGTKPATPREA